MNQSDDYLMVVVLVVEIFLILMQILLQQEQLNCMNADVVAVLILCFHRQWMS